MLDLLILAVIIVFIIDLSGFIDTISEFIWNRLYKGIKYNGWLIPKPFSCSLCMCWWVGIIYLIIIKSFTLPMLCYLAILSFFTTIIKDFLFLLKDLIGKLIDIIYKYTI